MTIWMRHTRGFGRTTVLKVAMSISFCFLHAVVFSVFMCRYDIYLQGYNDLVHCTC